MNTNHVIGITVMQHNRLSKSFSHVPKNNEN